MDDQKSKSKKPSGTKEELPHDDNDVTFFVDRCFGRGFWKALRAAGFKAEHKDDHFAQNTDDEIWMQEVGHRGWVVFTRDTRMRFHPNERAAVINSSLRMFTLQTKRGESGRRGINGKEMTEIFLENMGKISKLLLTTPGPFIAAVTRHDVKIIASATQS